MHSSSPGRRSRYLRPEALAAANARIVDAHHALPLAQHLGSGRFSRSDGKRHPVGVDSPEARAVGRYFGRGRGITLYVWTSDQHTHYATRVVRTTVRDATYVLDGILDNQTELPIEQHTTDTAGWPPLSQSNAAVGRRDRAPVLRAAFSRHVCRPTRA
jgi:TnpA family transposase